MNWLTPKTYPWVTLLLSGGLLIGAWIFQYGFGYPPCQMCYWQRHAHKAVIALSAAALVMPVFNYYKPRIWVWLIMLALLVSFALAFWHVGVEFKWWDGPKSCSGGGAITIDTKDLLSSLNDKIKPPSCDKAVWHFLGLSMAAWNAIASLFGAGLGALALRKAKI